MEEEANSWITRTKFSHTVYHRFDPSRLASAPLNVEQHRKAGLKARPPSSSNSISGSSGVKVEQDTSMNKQRSKSPLPKTYISDAFKEARSDRRRLSTPPPRIKEPDKSPQLHEDSPEKQDIDPKKRLDKSPLRKISSIFSHDKMKTKIESSWTKYFDLGGGKVTSVETAAEEWMVDLSKLFLGVRFAHGAHSQLYHGIYKDEPVAVKLIRVPDDDDNGVLGDRLEKQFSREVTILSRIIHQNVIRVIFLRTLLFCDAYGLGFAASDLIINTNYVFVQSLERIGFLAAHSSRKSKIQFSYKFVAACRKPPVFVIVTEYLSGGSLRAYLHKLGHKVLPLQKLIGVALDIARGMDYIHSQGIIHRDLKPENILINDKFRMKIADFGIACEEKLCDLLVDDPGTYRWMAPEMIKRKSYNRKVDVYSFGLIMCEMVTGAVPYEDMTPIQAAFAVVNKNLRPAIPSECPLTMKALIEQCWCLRPEKRPDFWQLVKVLEHFENLLAQDGNIDQVLIPSCLNHKKSLIRWIKKLGPKPKYK